MLYKCYLSQKSLSELNVIIPSHYLVYKISVILGTLSGFNAQVTKRNSLTVTLVSKEMV